MTETANNESDAPIATIKPGEKPKIQLTAALLEHFEPQGTILVVEPMGTKTVTPAGIEIPGEGQGAQFKWARVLKVGAGEYTSDGTLIPLPIQPGDIVILQLKTFSMPLSYSGVISATGTTLPEMAIVDYADCIGRIPKDMIT